MKTAAMVLCAWVLWAPTITEEGGRTYAGDPVVNDAFESRAECVKTRDRLVEGMAKGPTLLRIGWLCLPESVDPRGRKP